MSISTYSIISCIAFIFNKIGAYFVNIVIVLSNIYTFCSFVHKIEIKQLFVITNRILNKAHDD